MRLTALKSKEVDETGMCTNKKAEPRPGPARTEGQSPLSRAGRASLLSQADQDQHRPRGTAIIPGQTGTSADQVAEPCHRMECHTPWARFGAMQEGWGPSAGPSRRGAEPLQAEQAFSQSAVTNPWAQRQTRTSIDQDQHRPRGRALFPRQTRTSGSMLTSHQQEVLEHLDLGQYDGFIILL
jgi:hypothetical protein